MHILRNFDAFFVRGNNEVQTIFPREILNSIICSDRGPRESFTDIVKTKKTDVFQY